MNDQRRDKLESAWDEIALELLMDDYAELAGEELYAEYLLDKKEETLRRSQSKLMKDASS